jgi:hypothetical protein
MERNETDLDCLLLQAVKSRKKTDEAFFSRVKAK